MNPEVDRIDLYSGTPGFETYVGYVDVRTAEDIISAAPVEDIFKYLRAASVSQFEKSSFPPRAEDSHIPKS